MTDMTFFGDYCMSCGVSCNGVYCSTKCRQQDAENELDFDDLDMLPPQLMQSSSTSAYSSTPPSSGGNSPEITANRKGTHDPLVKLDLGPALQSHVFTPAAVAKKLDGLSFDYRYNIDHYPNDILGSARSYSDGHTERTPSEAKAARRISSQLDREAVSLTSSPATLTQDIMKLRRTHQQTPVSPRRISTNLVSPVLKPVQFSQSLAKKGRPSITETTSFNAEASMAFRRFSDLQRPLTLTMSSRGRACGKAECPSLLMTKCQPNESIDPAPSAMIRRVSEPAYKLTSAGVVDQPQIAGRSPSETSQTLASSSSPQNSRGRSRTPAKSGKRTESAHLLGASRAPICTSTEACVAAQDSLERDQDKPSNAQAARESTTVAAPRMNRFMFGRGRSGRQNDGVPVKQTKVTSGFSVSNDASNDTAIASSSSSSSEDEEERTARLPANARTADTGRGRSKQRTTVSAADVRSRSRPRHDARSRSRPGQESRARFVL